MEYGELDWPELLGILGTLAQSQKARAECLRLSSLSSAQDAQTSAGNVLCAQQVVTEQKVTFDLSVLDSINPILERLKIQAVLDCKEFSILRKFLTSASLLKNSCKITKNSWTDAQYSRISDFRSQLSAIDRVVSTTEEINEDASSLLASLFEEKRRLSREVARTLDQIVARRQLEPVLQDKYVTNREGRMVIPVKSGSQHDIKGLIHDSSQSKQTVFMEPDEVIPINNRLREVQILIQEEIYRILQELSHYQFRFLSSFENADLAMLDCDAAFAKAKMNIRLGGTAVGFSAKGEFKLQQLRHPLLVWQGVDVIPNSVCLTGTSRILLLSGPNAGGKTILLKSLGLAAMMARCGLPVPVQEGSQIPFFKKVDPIIGDLQSVGQNLSSFSSHMARLTKALNYNDRTTLLLVDEICGATDPEEGAALARSFIENFCEQNIFAVVTSHLGPLKENWPKAIGVEHGSLEFDSKTNRPTYQLLMGFPGRSLALSVAKELGVPTRVIDRARSYLSPESRTRSRELEDIENLKTQVLELRTEAAQNNDTAQKLKNQYSELVRKFREQRDRWLEKALEKAEKKIENLIESARMDRLKNRTLHDIKSELPEIIKAKPGNLKPQTLEEFKTVFKPGTPAFSSRLGRQVLIQSEPDSRGQVTVLADSMRVQLPWHGLSQLPTADDKPLARARSGAAVEKMTSVDSTVDYTNELDLRGLRIDEAMSRLEKWLDTSMKEQRDQLKVIHGFGTEQLKKAIRQYLSKSPYVGKWRAGDAASGGDGITWITLAD